MLDLFEVAEENLDLVKRYPAKPVIPRAVAPEIAAFDLVELTECVGDAPAGARGGVLELRDGDKAMIEVTRPALGPASRIVFAPLSKIRLIEPARRR